jgi:hypothetical protein
VYQQGASIRQERVKASNSCVRTLIFGSFFLLYFIKFFPGHFLLGILLSFLIFI